MCAFGSDFEQRDAATDGAPPDVLRVLWEPASAHRLAEQERRALNEGRQRGLLGPGPERPDAEPRAGGC